MKKHIARFLCLLLPLFAVPVQGQDDARQYVRDWATQYGEDLPDSGNDVAVGTFGDLYVAGSSRFLERSSGKVKAVLQTVDSSGEVSWHDDIRNGANNLFKSVAADHRGSVFVAGRATGPGSEDPASVYLSKYYALNLHCWFRAITASEYADGSAVVTDRCGNAYLCGTLRGEVEGSPVPHGQAAFVAKYDTFGNRLWLEFVDLPDRGAGQSVSVAADGLIYVSGTSTRGSYIAALNARGGTQQVELIRLPDATARAVPRILVHPDGKLICGGTSTPRQRDDTDGFVAAINRERLSLDWYHPIRTEAKDFVADIAVDSAGTLHVASTTSGALEQAVEWPLNDCRTSGRLPATGNQISGRRRVFRTRWSQSSREESLICLTDASVGNSVNAGVSDQHIRHSCKDKPHQRRHRPAGSRQRLQSRLPQHPPENGAVTPVVRGN